MDDHRSCLFGISSVFHAKEDLGCFPLGVIKAIFTPYRMAFAPTRKSYRIGLLFRHKNGSLGAISVTERNCAAPISSVAYRIGSEQHTLA